MAVATVVTAVRTRMSSVRTEGSLYSDDSSDIRLSYKELKRNLHKVEVRADNMVQVLALEKELWNMITKLPNFFLCMACFILALLIFSPPNVQYNIHRRISSHYNLDALQGIRDFNGVYNYMEDFEKRTEFMQATSFNYWCEKRYAVHSWDEHLMIPVHRCPSPRQYALQLTTNKNYAWGSSGSGSGAGSASGSSSGSSSSSSSGSSPRRMSASQPAASAGGNVSATTPTTTVAISPYNNCQDQDLELRKRSNDPMATCAAHAYDPTHLVCEKELGLLYCPGTCGFCGPFKYVHRKRFERPQFTLIPVMVYQTRFQQRECHGFAGTYQHQPYNPALTLLPALDGRRHANILTCIDREKKQESEYAFRLDCTKDTPKEMCISGKVNITLSHTFKGDVVYPKLMMEPHRDIERMKKIDWIDLQTEVVSLGTVIYTENVEVFTSLTVNFNMDEAGNINTSFFLVSYRDLVGSAKGIFIGCISACITGAFIAVLYSGYTMYKVPADERWDGDWYLACYELFSRLLLLIYPVVLIAQWTQQIPMALEYDHLLHSFLDLTGISEQHLEDGIQAYFDVKKTIWEESEWLSKHRIAAYGVCYVQFIQLILYFNAHPKMAVLTATVRRALDAIGHFLVLFGILFVMLAFMAHWMLGPHLKQFGSMGDTFATQVRIIYGEFIEADDVDKLEGAQAAMYWLYALTFFVLVIWILSNFFLAIIVDAFVEVKEDNEKNVGARDIITDLVGVCWTKVVAMKRGWPSNYDLLHFFMQQVDAHEGLRVNSLKRKGFLADLEANKTRKKAVVGMQEKEDSKDVPLCPPKGILEAFPQLNENRRVALFLHHYFHKCNAILNAKPKDRLSKAVAQDIQAHERQETFHRDEDSDGSSNQHSGGFASNGATPTPSVCSHQGIPGVGSGSTSFGRAYV